MMIGLVFSGSGIFTIFQDWWPGYIFAVIGTVIIFSAIFLIGRGVDVKIDTSLRVLYMRRKWFGFVLYKREVTLFDPSQFSIKKTSSSSNAKNLVEYYKAQVKDDDRQVLIVEGIKGKDVAQVVLESIIEKAFPNRF